VLWWRRRQRRRLFFAGGYDGTAGRIETSDHPATSRRVRVPNASDRDRATYWREFYDRMIAFEEKILSRMIDLSREMTEDERPLVEETNTGPVRSMIEDFKSRCDLWRLASLRTEGTDRLSGIRVWAHPPGAPGGW
jgi:hypothetical protein